MQVDIMFSAEAAITKKQNKKTERGTWVILHCLMMAQRRLLISILSKAAPLMNEQRKARKRETADTQMEEGEKGLLMNI